MYDGALAQLAVGDPGQVAPLIAAVRQIGDLPVLDKTVQRVLALCQDEDSSTAELIVALETDAAFTANLLRFANSAYAARPIRVRTIRQAVMMAGRESIGRLALEAATCRFLERAAGNGRASMGQMHIHASAVASCAVELAQRTGAAIDIAHLGGLLHDIGKLVMPLAFGQSALDEIAAEAPAGAARAQLERDEFGCDHSVAGAILASASHVDPAVVAAIVGHHTPDPDASPETACVQVANALVGMLNGIDPDAFLLERALGILQLQAADLDDVAASAGQTAHGAILLAPPEGAVAKRIATLEEQARTDELTGLANRRHWTQQAREILQRNGGTVMLCDIDRFKRVNDRNGHTVGDLVLSEVARILSRHGLAGRLGGDELVVIAHTDQPVANRTTAPSQARATAQKILDEVREAFPHGSVDGWHAGLSIGVAVAGDHRDLSALLKAADDALYEAKRSGRGRAVVADSLP